MADHELVRALGLDPDVAVATASATAAIVARDRATLGREAAFDDNDLLRLSTLATTAGVLWALVQPERASDLFAIAAESEERRRSARWPVLGILGAPRNPRAVWLGDGEDEPLGAQEYPES